MGTLSGCQRGFSLGDHRWAQVSESSISGIDTDSAPLWNIERLRGIKLYRFEFSFV
jgi:hypothetical protein